METSGIETGDRGTMIHIMMTAEGTTSTGRSGAALVGLRQITTCQGVQSVTIERSTTVRGSDGKV